MKTNSFCDLHASRRKFLGRLSATVLPIFFQRTPLATAQHTESSPGDGLAPPEYRLKPHYRMKSPLDDVIARVEPGLDAYPTERYAEEIEVILVEWKRALEQSSPDLEVIGKFLSPEFQASPLQPSSEKPLRSDPGLEIFQRHFSDQRSIGKEVFVSTFRSYLNQSLILNAEFKVTSISVSSTSPIAIQTRIRYDLAGTGSGYFREGRIGQWELEWEGRSDGQWRVRKWRLLEETLSRAPRPIFKDVSSKTLGGNASYHEQMLPGLDHWRTVLDAACGIDVYGNNGLAVGDFDNDGFDDFYVCQPSGLPNRLYRNRGDGTFEDVTEAAGVNVLDHTACALFADMNNNGRQDLLLVCSNGPLLFLNQGNGKFQLQQRAFSFAQAPQGTFTAASIADYDRDGWLDVYFCLYSYYQGLDQYRFPVPYHDAQNGPPNFLLRNNGDGTFRDVTASVGLSRNNNRYSFACGWSDYNNDGWPDLYVANDFGRKNLYRNNGDGTFTDVAEEAGVEDIGAGMGVCWLDHDNDGRQDLYVPNMWTAEGLRVTMQEGFMNKTPEKVRAQYRKHASGNSLLRNEGNGRFRDKSSEAKVEVGRWAWSSDAWDFDHDGYPDLYVVNGMVSGTNRRELNSFFWRQVVAQSPLELRPERRYEQGWNAINELIRSDRTWSGYERNLFYANNRDGTFSDISAVVGLDFLEDGRSFALADIDHDGRLELILKNRDTPQLRVLRNELPDLGHSIAFRLRGRKGNRDAIGAEVVIETERGRQSRFLQAGSGFLSQHTKEIFFGLGSHRSPIRAIVRWPSGGIEEFENVPMNSQDYDRGGCKAVPHRALCVFE